MAWRSTQKESFLDNAVDCPKYSLTESAANTAATSSLTESESESEFF